MKETFSSEEKFVVEEIKPIIESDADVYKGEELFELGKIYQAGNFNYKMQVWLGTHENAKRLTNAILNGYEIEEEKYAIRLTNKPNSLGNYTYLDSNGGDVSFNAEITNNIDTFTLAEIEAIDPRYLAFKKKVEE